MGLLGALLEGHESVQQRKNALCVRDLPAGKVMVAPSNEISDSVCFYHYNHCSGSY
jgi:hypothetical protein